ncbi:unnamed protein product [Brassica oleracea]
MGSPKLPALLKKFASKGHAEDLPFQQSSRRGLLIDDAFRRQQAVADKALFPKGSEEDWFETGSVLKTGQGIGFYEYLSSGR